MVLEMYQKSNLKNSMSLIIYIITLTLGNLLLCFVILDTNVFFILMFLWNIDVAILFNYFKKENKKEKHNEYLQKKL